MALKLNCPKCSTKNALAEPYPLPGDKIKCHSCSFSLTIAYPPQILKRLQEKGKQFRGEEPPPEVSLPEPAIDTVPKAPEAQEESTSPQKNTRPLPPEKPAQELEKEEEPSPPPKKKNPRHYCGGFSDLRLSPPFYLESREQLRAGLSMTIMHNKFLLLKRYENILHQQ